MRWRAGETVSFQPLDAFGTDVNDSFNVLQSALNNQERLLSNNQAKVFKHLRADNGVADSRFIFKADKYKALRRPGSLAANHISGDANERPMPRLWQIRCAPNPW